jgi:hypothetical protein
MKKAILFLIITVLMLNVGCIEKITEDKKEEEMDLDKSELVFDFDYDLRKIQWGMTIEGVRKNEEATLSGQHKTESLIYKNIEVVNYDADLIYDFNENGKLYKATYLFIHEYEDSLKLFYIDDFMNLKSILTEKYGEPEYYNEIGLEEKYHEDTEKTNSLLIEGSITLRARWETDRTDIFLELSSYDGDIYLYIDYFSKDIEHRSYDFNEDL